MMTLSDVSSNPPLYQIEILIMFNYLESKNALKNQQIFPAGAKNTKNTKRRKIQLEVSEYQCNQDTDNVQKPDCGGSTISHGESIALL